MPVKNPTTTWYRLPPPQSHAAPRHPSKPPQPQHPTPAGAAPSPRHAPPHNFASGLQLKHPSSPGASQIPGVRTPTGHSAQTSPVLPSKLPTSTSSSPNTSPKRTVEPQPSKIASPTLSSPTKLRHVDRLPPAVARGASASDQGAAAPGRPTTPNARLRGKDGRAVREKTNENRPRKSSETAKAETKDVKKKEKAEGKRPREPEGPKKKADVKAEPKVIPKRKKSERSNSDNEIKPKKMVAKEHPTPPVAKPPDDAPPEKATPARQVLRGKTPEKVSPSHAKEPRRIPPSPKVSQHRPHSWRKETPKVAEKRTEKEASKKPSAASGAVLKAEKKEEPAVKADVVEEPKDEDDDLDEDESIEGEYTLKDDDTTVIDDALSSEPVEGDTGTDLSDMSSRSAEGGAKGDEAKAKDVPAIVCPPEDDSPRDEDDRKSGVDVNDSSLSESLFTIEDSDRSTAFKDDCSTKYFSTVDDDLSMKEVSIDEDPSLEIAMSDDQSMKDDLLDDPGMRDDFLDDLIMKDCLLDDHGMRDDLLENLGMVNPPPEDQEMKENPSEDLDKTEDQEMKEQPSDDQEMKENPTDDLKGESEGHEMRGSHSADHEMKENPAEDLNRDSGYHELKGRPSNDHEMKDHPSDDAHGTKEAEEGGEPGPTDPIEDQTMKEESAMSEDNEPEEEEEEEKIPSGNENEVPKEEKMSSEKKDGGVGTSDDNSKETKSDKEGNKENAKMEEEEEKEGVKETKDENNVDNLTMEEDAKGEKNSNLITAKKGDTEEAKTPTGTDGKENKGNRGAKEAKAGEETRKMKEETKVTERRSKRKMEAERTRGGTKKPARVFVDKGSTASGGGSRGSRESRVHASARASTNTEKKRQETAPPPRRPRLDNIKSTIPKPGRLPPRKLTDPVKAARPVGPTSGPRGPHVGHGGSGPGQQHPVPHAEQLRRLEAEVAARAAEVKAARAERDQAGRGVEALSVIIHHLTQTYEPFSTPCLKAEVVRLTSQLTETRLNLDESTAAVRRLQEAAEKSVSEHEQKVQQLEQKHRQALEQLTKQHQHELDLVLEKQRKDMAKFAEEQQAQREDLSRAHKAELEQMEGEWRTKLDLQHEKHLCAVQELNTRHTQKLRELESSRRARESELEITNERLVQEQDALKLQSKKLEETLLNDTDHRLLAMRRMCTSLKSEVESLKTVVEMRNAEIHELRGQVVEMDRLANDLELARDKSKSLQAKTEDLQAQMEKRTMAERHLVNEHRLLIETYQRESNINKRLSLENEELAWKLRQREEIMSTSMPSSTLDLVSRSPAPARRQEGASSPQAAPRSPRVVGRTLSGKVSPSKNEASKRRSRLGLTPEDGMNGDSRVQEVSLESPPPSPCVKAVVEKSNSVSFILDLNDSQSDDSFLDLPPSPRPRPHRTASLSAADRPRTPTQARRVMHNNRTNSLNKNGIHTDGKSKNMNGRPKDFLGKARGMNGKAGEINGKSLDSNGHSSQPESGRSASESSEGGSEVERVSPTGLAWTVPVHKPKSPNKGRRQNGSPVRGRIEHHLLEDPEEDEYEETPSHQFIEVVELSGVGLASSSEAASDSELSQCDLIKGGSSTDSDSESSEGEHHNKKGSGSHQTLGHKGGPWCPKEGAGEAMITDELLKQYAGEGLTLEAKPAPGKRPLRRRLPSAPSSDSDDNNLNAHNNGTGDVSWSEDVDITSSSEMHEL